jgi:hypothetical protein
MKRPIQAKRILAGIGIAFGGHLLTILVPWAVAAVVKPGSIDVASTFLMLALIGQVVLAIAALATGITLAVKRDGGIGVGILIGWAIGLIISPILGFGVCVSLINNNGIYG